MGDKKEYAADNFKSTANLTSNPGLRSSLSLSSKQIDDEKTYDPFEHRNLAHPNSTIGSVLHLLKACLGSGILAMPAAFKNSGLVGGTIGTIFAGFLCTHAVHILVKTSQDVCVDAKKPLMGYAETCSAAFTYGPSRVRRWGPTIKTAVDISMFVAYFGILCVYVVFIATSFKEVLDFYIPDQKISIQAYCACTLVPLLLVCQIRNLKYLVPFSALANILVLVVFGITLYYIFNDVPDFGERELVANISQWPLFFSTVIFAMEGIGVVMPVENEMKKPQQFLGCPGVLNVSMVIVISLYGLVGFFGYVKYGDEVRGSITLNLPQEEWVAQCAKLLMAVVIFLSYTLQFYVPMEMITRVLERRWTNYNNVLQISVRIIIVSLSVGVSAAFPNLEMVISLVGAIFLSTLGLLIPAIIDTVYNWDRGLGLFNYILYKNIIIGFLSISALIAGSYVSIQDIISD